MFTLCNVYPACPVAPADGTGVESVTIPLGQNLFHWGLPRGMKFALKSTFHQAYLLLHCGKIPAT